MTNMRFFMDKFEKNWQYSQSKETIHKSQAAIPCLNCFQLETLQIENKKSSEELCALLWASDISGVWGFVSYFPISNNVSFLQFEQQKKPHKQMGKLSNTVSLGQRMKVGWLIIQIQPHTAKFSFHKIEKENKVCLFFFFFSFSQLPILLISTLDLNKSRFRKTEGVSWFDSSWILKKG